MAIQARMYPENLGLPLGGSQDWWIDSHLPNYTINFFNELSFSLRQKQHYEHQQLQLQDLQQRTQNQPIPSDQGFIFSPSSKNFINNANTTTASTITTNTTNCDHMPMNSSQNLAAQLEEYRQEIDSYISLQNERLHLALQEQRKQQVATLLKKLEAKAMMILKQKDYEIAKAMKRRIELEELVTKLEMEKEAWQRVAAENQAMVVSLNNALEQLKEEAASRLNSLNGADDAESCCDDNEYAIINSSNRGMEGRETDKKMMGTVCRFCKCRNATVLLLPCRHLCSCKACEVFLDACPLCNSVKKASMEALFS